MAYRLVSLSTLNVHTRPFPTISEAEDFLKQDASVGHVRIDEFCGQTADMRLSTIAEGKDTVIGTYLFVNGDVDEYQARCAEWNASHN